MWAWEGTQSEVKLCILKCIYYSTANASHCELPKPCTAWKTLFLAGRCVSSKECNRIVIPEKPPGWGRPEALATFEWQQRLPWKYRQVGKIFQPAWRTREILRERMASARWLQRQIVAKSLTQLKSRMSLETSLFLNTTHNYILLLYFSFYDSISKLMLRKLKPMPLVFLLTLSDSKSNLKQFRGAEYCFSSGNKLLKESCCKKSLWVFAIQNKFGGFPPKLQVSDHSPSV